ncbi:hypothetical protein BGZ94_001936, partial [Podila epigama]
MAPLPALSRSLAIFIACAVCFQLVLFFKSNSDTLDYNAREEEYSRDGANDDGGAYSNWNDPARNRHPGVPLSLEDLYKLDKLSETIAKAEAERVFGHKVPGSAPAGKPLAGGEYVFDNYIHGTKIKNDPKDEAKENLVDKVREQIHCWTTFGRWERQVDKEFRPLKHMGDSRFAKCDKAFIKALDQEGSGHYLGEYDHDNGRFMVREAVKYRWVPNESICGPNGSAAGTGQTKMGLQDERAVYKPFTKPAFCEVMERRNILVVGDLTQYQLHDVIVSAFESGFVCYGELGCLGHSAHGLCPGVALKYAQNDLLSVPWAVDPEKEEYPSASAVEQVWASPTMLGTFKVVLLNKGLIWRPDEVFMSELVFTMKELWKNNPDVLVIYRATHPVSNHCMDLKAQGEDEAIADDATGESIIPGTKMATPLKEPPRREDQEMGADGHEFYRPTLADIQRQNRIAKHI